MAASGELAEPGLVGTKLAESLFAERVLVPTAVPGLYLRSGLFESVVRAIEAEAHAVGQDVGGFEPLLFLPPLMPREAFVKTDYLRSFPDLIGSVHTFHGDNTDHARLMQLSEDGEDWTAALTPSEVVLCSAGCHSLYPVVDPAVPERGVHAEIQGTCFRHEPSEDLPRMQSFRMHEFVHIGTPDSALAHRDTWLELGHDLLRSLGLPVEKVVANDPFFGRVGRMLSRNQRESELKYELVCAVTSSEAPTAIASANYHLEHFGAPFALATPDGEVAHSSCFGFGLERIALALFATHGLDLERWPDQLQRRIEP